MSYNLQDVVESLRIKLADAEYRASQFEAVAKQKDRKIAELEEKLNEGEDKE